MNTVFKWILCSLFCLLAACQDEPLKPQFKFSVKPSPFQALKFDYAPTEKLQLKLPQDEAPHPVLTEWWYYTGLLQTKSHHLFGLQYVIFQINLKYKPTRYVAHVALIDLVNHKMWHEQKMLQTFALMQAQHPGFDFKLKDWRVQGCLGRDHLQVKMQDAPYAFDLALQDIKGIALPQHGAMSFGPPGTSLYYQRPYMSVTGSMSLNGKKETVSQGQIWFDHQWGNFILPAIGAAQFGWQWMNAQLADDSQLMVYYIQDAIGKTQHAYGLYIPPRTSKNQANRIIPGDNIAMNAITIENRRYWHSSSSKLDYPIETIVRIKQKNLPEIALNYQARFPAAELNTVATTGLHYWEGPVLISGRINQRHVTGVGYMETVGCVAKHDRSVAQFPLRHAS